MLLENKNAVIYGGGGAIGGAVVRAFVREGRGTFLDPCGPGATDGFSVAIGSGQTTRCANLGGC